MKQAIGVLITAFVLLSTLAAGVDFQSSTIADGHGVVKSFYGLYNGPTFNYQTYSWDTTGAFNYQGSYKNGGQISWIVTPPKDPKTLRELWEDKPAIFTSTFSRTGFPPRTNPAPGADFISSFNSFGASHSGPTFKPITFSSFGG